MVLVQTVKELQKLRVVDLKERLSIMKLSTSGLKADLVARLHEALVRQSEEELQEEQEEVSDVEGSPQVLQGVIYHPVAEPAFEASYSLVPEQPFVPSIPEPSFVTSVPEQSFSPSFPEPNSPPQNFAPYVPDPAIVPDGPEQSFVPNVPETGHFEPVEDPYQPPEAVEAPEADLREVYKPDLKAEAAWTTGGESSSVGQEILEPKVEEAAPVPAAIFPSTLDVFEPMEGAPFDIKAADPTLDRAHAFRVSVPHSGPQPSVTISTLMTSAGEFSTAPTTSTESLYVLPSQSKLASMGIQVPQPAFVSSFPLPIPAIDPQLLSVLSDSKETFSVPDNVPSVSGPQSRTSNTCSIVSTPSVALSHSTVVRDVVVSTSAPTTLTMVSSMSSTLSSTVIVSSDRQTEPVKFEDGAEIPGPVDQLPSFLSSPFTPEPSPGRGIDKEVSLHHIIEKALSHTSPEPLKSDIKEYIPRRVASLETETPSNILEQAMEEFQQQQVIQEAPPRPSQEMEIAPPVIQRSSPEKHKASPDKPRPTSLVSIEEINDEDESETPTVTTNNLQKQPKESKNQRRKRKKKKSRQRKMEERERQESAEQETELMEKELDVEIDYIGDVVEPKDPMYFQFLKVFDKFKLEDNTPKEELSEEKKKELARQEEIIARLAERKKPADIDEKDDEEENKDDDKPKLSKRKAKKLNRLSVAELKQRVFRPELVEMHDVTAKDPVLLLHLKSARNSVPVPRHWCFKRKYLQGKRGIEKPPFNLPDFIKKTGIMEMRQALQEKEEQKTMKAKMRERVRPKMGKIDIDYQKLHDAFFKWQIKPRMTIHGDLYYEGKEFETRLKEKKPGDLGEELRIALGMPTGPNFNKCPPPWLIAMQRYGPPPSYPNLKIPGLNAPIPDGCSFGYHAGGWGKPPVDEMGRPLYGDVFGSQLGDAPLMMEEEVDRTLWGELESDSSEESEEESEEEEETEEKLEDESGLVTPAEGLVTPSGLSSVPAGMETPDMIELRKKKIESEMEGGETPSLYTILPEKATDKVGASMMGSTHIYDISAAMPAAAKPRGVTGAIAGLMPPQGVDVNLDPSELEMDSAAMAARYEQTVREQQSQLAKEDLSDMVAEHAARQKNKRKKQQQDTGKAPKKYKEFKF